MLQGVAGMSGQYGAILLQVRLCQGGGPKLHVSAICPQVVNGQEKQPGTCLLESLRKLDLVSGSWRYL